MRNIREVLRLKFDLGLSDQLAGRSIKVARSTVQEYVKRAHDAGLTWPLPPDLSDAQLEHLLFQRDDRTPPKRGVQPDWAHIDRELHRKGVTRRLLWEEHHRLHPDSVQYASFADTYRRWKAVSGLSMRQVHHAGDKLFVDYAGVTVPITDPGTGVVHPGQVFVATLGASDYTYAEVTRTQTSDDWLGSHLRALTFFGGVPEIIVPDNLKAGVTHACHYEPRVNRAYAEFAEYYGVAIIPARVRRPKDKALVEVHVQIVERQLLAPLRDQTFFSVMDANEALWAALGTLNERPFQKRPGSRLELFQALDQPALRALPPVPFEIARWTRTTVGLDYHVEVDGHHYSVPYRHAKARVDVRLTPHLVEVFLDRERIAVHHRVLDTSSTRPRQTTVVDHMPPRHQLYGNWTPQTLQIRATELGAGTAQLVDGLLGAGRHPEQGMRATLGIFKLAQAYGAERLDAACVRAVALQTFSYRSVASILQHHLDEQPLIPNDPAPRVPTHANVRGPAYYHTVNGEQGSPPVSDPLLDPTLN